MVKRLKTQRRSGYVRKWKKDTKKVEDKLTICYTPHHAPDIMRVKLQYVRSANITGTGIADYIFRGNSVFDPDFTGIGNQPLGHDQWAAFYRRYRVLASKITLYCSSQDTGDSVVMYVLPLNTSSAFATRETILEQIGAKQQILSITSGQNRGVLESYMSTNAIRGVPKDSIRTDADYSANIANNPALEWFWHFGAFDTSNALDGINVDLMVKAEYYVEYFDRETLVSS